MNKRTKWRLLIIKCKVQLDCCRTILTENVCTVDDISFSNHYERRRQYFFILTLYTNRRTFLVLMRCRKSIRTKRPDFLFTVITDISGQISCFYVVLGCAILELRPHVRITSYNDGCMNENASIITRYNSDVRLTVVTHIVRRQGQYCFWGENGKRMTCERFANFPFTLPNFYNRYEICREDILRRTSLTRISSMFWAKMLRNLCKEAKVL